MTGDLLGEAVGWIFGELVSEAVGEALGRVFPSRVTGFGLAASLLLLAGLLWAATAWWGADPPADARTEVVCLAWVALPVAAMMLGLAYCDGLETRRRWMQAYGD